MRKWILVLGLVGAVTAAPMSARAHGGCYSYGYGGWPFFAFGLGLTTAATVSYLAYEARQPVYVYQTAPVYTVPSATVVVSAPPARPAPAAPAAPVETQVTYAEPAPWVPSTPGAGRWVPDPTPYRYAPAAKPPTIARATSPATVAPSPYLVSACKSPEGITVYQVTR